MLRAESAVALQSDVVTRHSSLRHSVTPSRHPSPVTQAIACAAHHIRAANFLSHGDACAAFHTMFFANLRFAIMTCARCELRGMHLANSAWALIYARMFRWLSRRLQMRVMRLRL